MAFPKEMSRISRPMQSDLESNAMLKRDTHRPDSNLEAGECAFLGIPSACASLLRFRRALRQCNATVLIADRIVTRAPVSLSHKEGTESA